MKRAMVVVLIAVVTAYVSGVDNTMLAAGSFDQDTAQLMAQRAAHRQALVQQLQGMRVGTPIQVERTGGETLDVAFQSVTTDAVTVLLPRGGRGVPQTIALDDIARIRTLGRSTARKVLIGIGVSFAALVGVCTVVAASTRRPRPRPSS